MIICSEGVDQIAGFIHRYPFVEILLDPAIKLVVMIDCPASHISNPTYKGMCYEPELVTHL